MGVVVRRYIDILTIILNYPYTTNFPQICDTNVIFLLRHRHVVSCDTFQYSARDVTGLLHVTVSELH